MRSPNTKPRVYLGLKVNEHDNVEMQQMEQVRDIVELGILYQCTPTVH